ncbi:hypothetical protein P7K49_040204 [Saguinus oedipus]|uniref:CTCK domain-containing protein n=1 Tax=Saguinus oedipus TaxID=9490 RepID=A0ABQ9T8L7_SAGOE|nr:hypothetical protein P7K49_040204 [Saguinus oedipus]
MSEDACCLLCPSPLPQNRKCGACWMGWTPPSEVQEWLVDLCCALSEPGHPAAGLQIRGARAPGLLPGQLRGQLLHVRAWAVGGDTPLAMGCGRSPRAGPGGARRRALGVRRERGSEMARAGLERLQPQSLCRNRLLCPLSSTIGPGGSAGTRGEWQTRAVVRHRSSLQELYSLKANVLEHRCQCCQELRTSPRNVTLHCSDGSRRAFRYTEVEECGCTGRRCPAPDDTQHWEEAEPEQSQEAESRNQERGAPASSIN